ncbi:MAG: hypothetical protein EOO52_19510 [Gammaproteobacteria bacterium]|nr:MAG: hypothetical protein EOO52_19510 [Gammaproteobacteria bacterium]
MTCSAQSKSVSRHSIKSQTISSVLKFSFLKKLLAVAAAGLIAAPCVAALSVKDGQLVDANGQAVVLRGVTINHDLAPEKTIQSLKDAAALGANSAQIEFTLRDFSVFPRPIVAQIRQIVETCKLQKLICVLEPNDVAGFGTTPGSTSPSGTVSYWTDLRQPLMGTENFIIVGLGNQHFDNDSASASVYRDGMETYIQGLDAQLSFANFVIMVDGNRWSQDTDRAMHDLARKINNNESLKKQVIYSVDFFDQHVNPDAVRDYIEDFKNIGAPLVIGGFAPVPYYHPFFQGPLPLNAPLLPAEAVMQYAQQHNVGYFAWSWSGNKNPALDLVSDWSPAALTRWGQLAFNSANGIKATSKLASIFTDGSSSSSSSANRPPVANISVAADPNSCHSQVLSGLGSTDPDGDTLTYEWENLAFAYSPTFEYPEISTLVEQGKEVLWQLKVRDGKGGVDTETFNQTYVDNCASSSSSSVYSSTSSVRSSSSSVRSTSSSSAGYSSSSKSSASSSLAKSSSSSRVSSSFTSVKPSSSSQPSSLSSSSKSVSSAASSVAAQGSCTYVVNNQWSQGFTASIRVKNTGTQPINGWNVTWQYTDGSSITGSWNTSLSGTNPYAAKNLSWNTIIKPGQTVEFGFQGKKPAGAAGVPKVTGSVCQ